MIPFNQLVVKYILYLVVSCFLFFYCHRTNVVSHLLLYPNSNMKNICIDRQTDKQRNRQTDKQRNRQTDRQTDKQTDRPIWTHGSIVNVRANCLSDLHFTHKTEPRGLYDGNHCRPDIVYFNPQSGTDVELDISLACPWNGDILSLASNEDGAAAARREQQKVTKYGQQFDIFGILQHVYLLCLNTLVVGVEELRVYYVIYQPFQSTKMDRTTALTSLYTGNNVFPLRCSGVMQE